MIAERIPTAEELLATLDRPLPVEAEAENGLLSCLLQEPNRITSAKVLPPTAFAQESAQLLYDLFIELYDGDKPLDPILVTKALRERGLLEKAGGPAHISEIFAFAPIPAHFGHYYQIVAECYEERRQIHAHARALHAIQNRGQRSIHAVMDEVKGILEEAQHAPGKLLSRRHVYEVAEEVFGQIQDRAENPGKLAGFTTGLATLDEKTGGMQAGQVWVFAGMPGDGKSTIIQNMAEAACKTGARIGWYPLEMPDTEQTFRIISSLSEVDNQALYSGMLSRGQQEAISAAMTRMEKLGIELVNTDGATATTIIADIEQANYDIAVVDYLQLLEDDGTKRNASREQIISDISRRLKKLAVRSKTCILTASQLNDSGKLRESRAIGQDADKVFIIQKCPADREEGRNPQTIQEGAEFDDSRRILWADKNRGGKRHFELPLRFLGNIFQFREIQA
jgi:replicative DNA helicase